MTSSIERRKCAARRPTAFVESFNQIVLDEFFGIPFRTKLYETVDALEADLDTWLSYNNVERSHQGYRNMGRRPIDTINEYTDTLGIET